MIGQTRGRVNSSDVVGFSEDLALRLRRFGVDYHADRVEASSLALQPQHGGSRQCVRSLPCPSWWDLLVVLRQ